MHNRVNAVLVNSRKEGRKLSGNLIRLNENTYGELLEAYDLIRDVGFVPADDKERNERCEHILSIQSEGLKKRLLHTGAKKAVIGLSGGLDSTLALLVMAKAFDLCGLDRSGIIAVTMPCFGTTDRKRKNIRTMH